MKKQGKKVVWAVLLASVLPLAACGKDSGSSAAMEEQADAAIKFCWWGGDSRHLATENAVNAFMQEHPDITVTPEYGAWSGWQEKQSLAILGGNAADVMQINWNWIANYGNNGQNFADLNQYQDILDLSQFDQAVLDQCSVDGKLMAVPVSMTGCLFFWNKTTFDTIGCDIPTDKESLLAAGAKFKAYGDEYYPLVFDGGYSRMIFLVYYLESVYGKPWVENGELQYTAEEVQEGMDFITELEQAHVIPTLAVTSGDMADSTDKNPKWIDGKYAGVFVWDATSIMLGNAVKDSVNVPGQELVQGEFIKLGDYNGGFTKISMCYAIAANSEHPRAGAMLINYLLNHPQGVEICALERGVPLSKAGVKLIEEKGIGDPALIKANKSVLEFSRFPLDAKFESSELRAAPDGAYEKAFGKLSFGEIDSATAAKQLTDRIKEVLAE